MSDRDLLAETWHRCGSSDGCTHICPCTLVWPNADGPPLSVVELIDDDTERKPPESVMRLLATSPDMARLLIEAEWAGMGDYGSSSECFFCGDSKVYGTHREDCRWLWTMRKAGLR